MTGVGRVLGRLQRPPQRLLGLVVAVVVVLTAGSEFIFSPTADGQVPVWSTRSDLPSVPIVSPEVGTEPSDGALDGH